MLPKLFFATSSLTTRSILRFRTIRTNSGLLSAVFALRVSGRSNNYARTLMSCSLI
jgi:hypothetical protein